jgi:uncharacterized membrane protein
MIRFESDVRIRRPLEEVYSYLSEPLNLPQWNSAVQVVHRSSSGTYAMERTLPTGRAVDTLEVEASEGPRAFQFRARGGPTPFRYRYRLEPEPDETLVRLDAEVELPGAGPVLERLAGRAVKRGVHQNLETLKHILETGY